jgi:hypothetical protein
VIARQSATTVIPSNTTGYWSTTVILIGGQAGFKPAPTTQMTAAKYYVPLARQIPPRGATPVPPSAVVPPGMGNLQA